MIAISLRKVICTSLLLVLSFSVAAQTLTDPLPVNPLLKVGKLDNGLTYYIQKNTKPEKRVELRLVVKAGSILEDEDQQGLAHFTEHMAFNGSTHFKKHELISYLQSIGVKFGADLNAYTSFDETVYMLPIPIEAAHVKGKKSNLETGMLVLEDWAHGLTMTDANIDAERKIILEEARLGKGAFDRMNKQLYPALFNGSRYAERLPIGKEDIISNFDHSAIRRFYADWYRPDLMAVYVVGDVDPAVAEKMIKEHFAQLKNPAHERPRDYATIPTRTDSASLVITDKEATNNLVMIRYPIVPSKQDVTIGDYRDSLIKNLSAEMLNQRLQELTQQSMPPFLAGSTGIETMARGYESYSAFAYIGRSGVEPAIDALVQENERARQFGFSQAELDRSKKSMQRMYESQYNERDKSESSSFVSEYIRNFLTGESIPGIANEYDYVVKMLPGITLEEINQYAQKSIPDNAAKLVAYMGSDKEGEVIPDKAQLLAFADAAEKTKVLANADKAEPASLMTQVPAAGSIVSETHNAVLGLTELTLSNGIKVILKPTDFKSDQVLLTATRFGGQSLYADADMFNARYTVPVEYSMGLATYTPTDLQKILSGKAISFQTNLGNYTESLSGNASSADIESLFQSVYLRFAAPRQDPNLFNSFISRMEDLSKNSMARPESVFSNTISTTLYNNHPRLSLAPKPDDFKQVSLARTGAIYNDRLTSAKGLTFILVGSFKTDEIKPLIATYLASLPTTDIPLGYRDLNIRPVAGVVKKEVHVGSEPKSQVTIVFSGPADYSKEENMRFQALIEIMNIRVVDILREKLTLIYGGGLGGVIDRIPYQNYRLSASFPCGPENVDKVVAAAFAEFEKMKQQGPTVEELNKVKLNWVTNQKIAIRTNEQWLSYLQDATLYHTDPADILTLEQRTNALTLDDIKQAANRYLNTANYVQVVLYPEQAQKLSAAK
jgi:zinc protease